MRRITGILAAAVLCAAMFVAAGCAKKAPQTATVTLPSNPTTGYSWTVTQTNELFDITSEYTSEQTGNIAGAGGYDTFTLTPKTDGETTVEFVYARGWEKEKDPESTATYQVKVDKNMQITVESYAGSLPGSAEEVPELPEMEIR